MGGSGAGPFVGVGDGCVLWGSSWALAPPKDAITSATATVMADRARPRGSGTTPQDDDGDLIATEQPEIAVQPPGSPSRHCFAHGLGEVANEESREAKR